MWAFHLITTAMFVVMSGLKGYSWTIEGQCLYDNIEIFTELLIYGYGYGTEELEWIKDHANVLDSNGFCMNKSDF